jgi:hypothetical protein
VLLETRTRERRICRLFVPTDNSRGRHPGRIPCFSAIATGEPGPELRGHDARRTPYAAPGAVPTAPSPASGQRPSRSWDGSTRRHTRLARSYAAIWRCRLGMIRRRSRRGGGPLGRVFSVHSGGVRSSPLFRERVTLEAADSNRCCCLTGRQMRVRTRVKTRLHTVLLPAVRRNVNPPFTACFSLTQPTACCLAGLLIPRSQVRSLPGPSNERPPGNGPEAIASQAPSGARETQGSPVWRSSRSISAVSIAQRR